MIIDDPETKTEAAKKPKIEDPDHPIQQKIRLENQKYW